MHLRRQVHVYERAQPSMKAAILFPTFFAGVGGCLYSRPGKAEAIGEQPGLYIAQHLRLAARILVFGGKVQAHQIL